MCASSSLSSSCLRFLGWPMVYELAPILFSVIGSTTYDNTFQSFVVLMEFPLLFPFTSKNPCLNFFTVLIFNLYFILYFIYFVCFICCCAHHRAREVRQHPLGKKTHLHIEKIQSFRKMKALFIGHRIDY